MCLSTSGCKEGLHQELSCGYGFCSNVFCSKSGNSLPLPIHMKNWSKMPDKYSSFLCEEEKYLSVTGRVWRQQSKLWSNSRCCRWEDPNQTPDSWDVLHYNWLQHWSQSFNPLLRGRWNQRTHHLQELPSLRSRKWVHPNLTLNVVFCAKSVLASKLMLIYKQTKFSHYLTGVYLQWLLKYGADCMNNLQYTPLFLGSLILTAALLRDPRGMGLIVGKLLSEMCLS